MGFHEQACNTHSNGSARQHRNHRAYPPAAGALAAGQLHRVRGIKHHRSACLAHDGQRAHIADQVVITKTDTALAGHEVVFWQASSNSRSPRFDNDVFHVTGGHELALFDVHRLARQSHRVDEIGLPTQEGGGLQHVHHRRDLSDLVFAVNIGENRHAYLAPDLRKNLKPFFHSKAPVCRLTRSIGLVKTALENKRNAKAGGDFLQRACGIHLQLLGLNHAGASNQEKRLVEADVKSTKLHLKPPLSRLCLLFDGLKWL